METNPYNHTEENTAEACGLNSEIFQTKCENFCEKLADEFKKSESDTFSVSEFAERVEAEFNHRELALLASTNLIEAVQKTMFKRKFSSKLEE